MAFARAFFLLLLAFGALWLAPPGLAREEAAEPIGRPELLVQLGHAGGAVAAVAFSPDGRLIATAGFDNIIRLWERATGRELSRVQQSESSINALAFSPDGKTLLAGFGDVLQRQRKDSSSHGRSISGSDRQSDESDNVARLWEVRTGREVRTLLHRTMVTAVAFSPDGARILTGSVDGMLRLWSAASGEAVWTSTKGHRKAVVRVAFSPHGEMFLTADEQGGICLWNAAEMKKIRSWAAVPLLLSASFSPDGNLVITRSEREGPGPGGTAAERACAWSVETGKQRRCVEHAVLAPDGLSAVFVEPAVFLGLDHGLGEERARRLDLSSGAERRLPLDGAHGTTVLAFAPEGNQVLLGHSEGARLFDLHGDTPPVGLERLALPVWSVALSPGGQRLAVGDGDGLIHLWRTDTGKEEERALGWIEPGRSGARGVLALTFPEDDNLLLSLSQGIARLWNLESGQQVRVADPGRFSETFLAADGRTLLQGSHLESFALRDGVTGVETGRIEPLQHVLLALSREARLGVSLSEKGVVCQELARGRELWRHPMEATLGAFSPDDGRVALGSTDGDVAVVETATGKERWRIRGRRLPLTAFAFSSDGSRLATSDGGGLTVLWDAASGKRLRALEGNHQGGITQLAFSPGDRFLLTTGNDATTRLWNPQTGEEICRLVSLKDGTWVVAAPDGRFDTNRLDEIPGLHWVMPDDPFTSLTPEVFLRDYYEPRLLPRLLAGDPLPPVRPLADLNRAQPEVRIARVSLQPGVPDEAVVEVEVASTVREIERDGRVVRMESGVRDLHLLREGRLVQVEESIPLDADGRARRSFHVRLPRRAAPREVAFSAYAFNADRVKSATHTASVSLPPGTRTVAGRAFVVAIGVADNESRSWRLSYPANDARRMLQAAGEALRRSGRYREVVEMPLISGRNQEDLRPGETLPTKANLRTALELLAGQARPEDLVLITFSGHGTADASGVFHLYPYDLGGADEVPAERTISSDELASWLRGVDAGEMVLVLDACRSGAAAGPDFKPAPLGDRGLGQLAYDKRMLILAATQADEDAVGSGALRHGLLTYALTKEGLEDGKAVSQEGFRFGAWLVWGRDRLPGLYAEKVAPDRLEAGRVQEPVLFDFTRR